MAWLPPVHTADTDCIACHTPTHGAAAPYGTTCTACHQNAGVSWAFTHSASASNCAGCHADPGVINHPDSMNCVQCHPFGGAPLNRSDNGEHYDGQSNADCWDCHSPSSNEHFSQVPPLHVDGVTWSGKLYACTDCHGTTAQIPAAAAAGARVAPLAQPAVTEVSGTYQLDWSGGTMPYTILVDDIATATVGTPAYSFSPASGEYSIVVSDASGERTDPVTVTRAAVASYTPPAAKTLSGYIEYAVPEADSSASIEATAPAVPSDSATDSSTADAAHQRSTRDEPGEAADDKHDAVDEAALPESPDRFKVRISEQDAALTWTVRSGMHYEVQQADNSSFSDAKRAWTGTGGETEIGPFSADDEVWFRIRTRTSADGEPGPWSDAERIQFPAEDKAPAPPEAPKDEAKNPEDDPKPEVATPAPSIPDEPTVDSQAPAETPMAEEPAEANPVVETTE